MTPENKQKYDAKVKRVNDAIALKEPDRIPIKPSPAIFPILDAGYTVAECIYDPTLEKYKDAITKYLLKYDPDAGIGTGNNYAGQGHIMELNAPKNMRWAGMPGDIIDKNSIQQYIEYPFLLDDEFDMFWNDRTNWLLTKAMPRSSTVTEPLANLHLSHSHVGIGSMVAAFSSPEMREMIKRLWEIADAQEEFRKKSVEISKYVEDLGFPIFQGGGAAVPFDSYSDNLRGTINSLADLYERPEDVERYIDEAMEQTLAMIKASKGKRDGKHVFMALHKGMDGFMSDAHYERYYWRYLRDIIYAIIDAGQVPYIFTEGNYNTRLKFLKDVPKGKVYYHFETVDMVEAKRILGDTACISGGFPTQLMTFGTKEQVITECKRIIDACAPGGGFIFETSFGLDYCKRENVEAMFETVREYGKK